MQRADGSALHHGGDEPRNRSFGDTSVHANGVSRCGASRCPQRLKATAQLDPTTPFGIPGPRLQKQRPPQWRRWAFADSLSDAKMITVDGRFDGWGLRPGQIDDVSSEKSKNL